MKFSLNLFQLFSHNSKSNDIKNLKLSTTLLHKLNKRFNIYIYINEYIKNYLKILIVCESWNHIKKNLFFKEQLLSIRLCYIQH